MADFCRQCSILMFGEDFHELAERANTAANAHAAICEGCGFIWVDHNGRCLDHTIEEHMTFILGADYVDRLKRHLTEKGEHEKLAKLSTKGSLETGDESIDRFRSS